MAFYFLIVNDNVDIFYVTECNQQKQNISPLNAHTCLLIESEEE